MRKRILTLLIIDLIVVTFSFLLAIWLKPSTLNTYLPDYLQPFLIFLLIWIASAFVTGKYIFSDKDSQKFLNRNILISNFLAFSFVAILMYSVRVSYFSRQVVFITIVTGTFLNVLLFNLYFYFVNAREILEFPIRSNKIKFKARAKKYEKPQVQTLVSKTIEKDIEYESGRNVLAFIKENVNLLFSKTLVISTTTRFNVDKQPDNFYENIVNLKRINDIRYINKFFESVNGKLPGKGLFIGCAETKNQRKMRILSKFPPLLNYIYYFFDYIIKRVLPKLPYTKSLYFLFTRGQNRVLSRAEILGRLYSCGFRLVEEQVVDNSYFFVVSKNGMPVYDENPTYGPFIKLKRIGKNGKEFKVYKLRTMHPYAEYLQNYMIERHPLKEGGKFKDDFRITNLGRIMRKFWLDEIPMTINVLKGQIKLVGVRPISEQYSKLYSKKLQEKRKRVRPGFIPPFYADLPKTLQEIEESELRFLESYEKHPIRTNWNYFWKAVWNITFNRARSN
ncbi:sugar transferase [Bacteroidota bacterium]